MVAAARNAVLTQPFPRRRLTGVPSCSHIAGVVLMFFARHSRCSFPTPFSDGVISSISLCHLRVLCVSVVNESGKSLTTETQRTQRWHRAGLRREQDAGDGGKSAANWGFALAPLPLGEGKGVRV